MEKLKITIPLLICFNSLIFGFLIGSYARTNIKVDQFNSFIESTQQLKFGDSGIPPEILEEVTDKSKKMNNFIINQTKVNIGISGTTSVISLIIAAINIFQQCKGNKNG